MKGDVVNLTRIIGFRLALAAFFLSLVALSIYLAGNLQELSDPALFTAINWTVGASSAGLVFSGLTVLASFATPVFSGRFPLLTILGSILVIAANLAVLVLASALRVASGGIPL